MHRDKESLLIIELVKKLYKVISYKIFNFEKIKKLQIVHISYALVIKSFYSSIVAFYVYKIFYCCPSLKVNVN